MSNAGAVVVAMRMHKERQIVAALREGAAQSAASAIPLPEAKALRRAAFRALIRNGAVKETSAGAYYLDEAAYETMRTRRRFRVSLLLAAVVLVAAIIGYGAMINT